MDEQAADRWLAVALKRVALRPEVDALTGEATVDERLCGPSDADLAALEHALRLAETWGWQVVVVSAGAQDVEEMLRAALAAGAHRAVRVELAAGPTPGWAPDIPSQTVAVRLASVVQDCELVLCGDHSLDRGSGSVPAFLADALNLRQALGLVSLTAGDQPGELIGERRLDQGRRERLRVRPPAVVSVEPGHLRLRRAPLAAVLAAGAAEIAVVGQQPVTDEPWQPGLAGAAMGTVAPYRPRTRVLPAPSPTLSARERILALTGAAGPEREPPRVVRAEPAQAAEEFVAYLTAHGYWS